MESFHPSHVFDSVALSQMLRIMNRNSTERGRARDLEKLEEDLERSGHSKTALVKTRERAVERHGATKTEKPAENSIVCVVNYFYEIDQLKSILRDADSDIKHLVGEEVKIMVAARRCPTIRDNVVKNRQFSKEDIISKPVFKACTSKRCLTCPMYKSSGSISVNSISFKILNKFNCKTDNCIYLVVCKICRANGCSDNAYVGQTTQPLHCRMNGHRACFTLVGSKWEKSALSLHAFEKHPEEFSLSNFEVTVLCQVGTLALDRQESFFIEKFRTNTRGLNRMVVRR